MAAARNVNVLDFHIQRLMQLTFCLFPESVLDRAVRYDLYSSLRELWEGLQWMLYKGELSDFPFCPRTDTSFTFLSTLRAFVHDAENRNQYGGTPTGEQGLHEAVGHRLPGGANYSRT